MLEEIHQQPTVLEETLKKEYDKAIKIGDYIRRSEIDLIILVARGSSDNASLFGRYLLEISTGIPVSLSAPSVFTLYNARLKLKNALVIGVSQSGEGDDINLVLEEAGKAGAFTIGITNEAGSTMAKIASETLLIHAGKEKSVAATKTYTGQMLQFYLLASAIGNSRITLNKIPEFCSLSLSLASEVRQIAERFVLMENCVVLGRGLNYGNAFELGLKLMETCYVVAERFSSADFLHGPLAIIERRFPVILFAPRGATSVIDNQLIARLRELNAYTLVISNDGAICSQSSLAIRLPFEIEELYTPIPFAVPAQLFAAYLAEAKGLNPDSPRSLTKVTKTL
jgi:glucosamine--fructose-6-phosphate aminotransferase (isomerizing)